MVDDKYGFSPVFENIVAVMAATHPRFHNIVGHSLQPAYFRKDEHALLVKAAQSIAKELGTGPSDIRTIMQRIDRWVSEGSVTRDQRIAALDALLDAPEMPPEDEVIVEATNEVKRKLQAEAVREAMSAYGKRADFDHVAKLIEKSKTVGKVDMSIGSQFGLESIKRIRSLAIADRLPTGVPEIDSNLDGGLPRGNMGMISAGSGGGKSMFLINQTGMASRGGLFVCLATLEIAREMQEARLTANLTGFPINTIQFGTKKQVRKVHEALEALFPVLGEVVIQDFPAKITTVPHIIDWVTRCEDKVGQQCDVLVVDYADKLRSHDVKDQSSYDAGGTITESLRLWTHTNRRWVWTASQPRRSDKKDKSKRIDIDDLSDSQHKARVTDLLLTVTEAEDQLTYFCAKYRPGVAGWTVGPLPHDWERARQVVMTP